MKRLIIAALLATLWFASTPAVASAGGFHADVYIGGYVPYVPPPIYPYVGVYWGPPRAYWGPYWYGGPYYGYRGYYRGGHGGWGGHRHHGGHGGWGGHRGHGGRHGGYNRHR